MSEMSDSLHNARRRPLLARLLKSGRRRGGPPSSVGRDEDGPRGTDAAAPPPPPPQAVPWYGGGRRRRGDADQHVFGEQVAPGTAPPPTPAAGSKSGHQVLLDFLNHINPATSGLAKMLANRNPISDNASGYRYVVHQSTEQSDLAVVLRDLTDGRLYRAGVRLVAAPWANLLFGDSFAAQGNRRQLHELVYRRSTCTCIVCMIRQHRANQEADASSSGSAASSASLRRTSPESAMANFTLLYAMPVPCELVRIGAESQSRELEIGQLVRLQSRNTAKLVFTDDVRTLFGNLAYTGPMSHEELYRKVTTIGVNYFLYNKGKKSRRVYLQGDLLRLPLELGVVKCGAHAMYLKEVGSTYVLYKPQVMSIYIGTIVLEGNSLGTFISTNIKFYVGFGQEDGCVPVYPNGKATGAPRRLGVNELLLHHHQVGDFEVTLR